jgi:hypothetical protein
MISINVIDIRRSVHVQPICNAHIFRDFASLTPRFSLIFVHVYTQCPVIFSSIDTQLHPFINYFYTVKWSATPYLKMYHRTLWNSSKILGYHTGQFNNATFKVTCYGWKYFEGSYAPHFRLSPRNFCLTGFILPILVVALPKAWVCGRSLAGIAGSNPAGGMDVCLL